MIEQQPARLYDEAFYAAQAPGSARSAAVALSLLFAWTRPRRVVDVGCGVGTWLHVASLLGAETVTGFDGDHVAPETLLIPPGCFLPIRLECDSPAASLPQHQRRFDLVMSLETAEHLPHARSAGFVRELTELGDLVLFSAAIPFQNGTGHINEQWPEFWAMLFHAEGFSCFDPLRPLLMSRPEVDWWYAQNILLFARRGSPAEAALPEHSRADRQPLSRVHPVNLLVQTLWNYRTHRVAARNIEEADYVRLSAAWSAGADEPPALATVAAAGTGTGFPATRMVLGDPEAALRQAHAAQALAEGALREASFRIEALQRRCDIAEQGSGATQSASSGSG